MQDRDTSINGMRPLTLEEVEDVSGGFWGAVIGLAIAAVTIIVEAISHQSNPDPLKGFGQNED